jgi:hypothetical protein
MGFSVSGFLPVGSCSTIMGAGLGGSCLGSTTMGSQALLVSPTKVGWTGLDGGGGRTPLEALGEAGHLPLRRQTVSKVESGFGSSAPTGVSLGTSTVGGEGPALAWALPVCEGRFWEGVLSGDRLDNTQANLYRKLGLNHSDHHLLHLVPKQGLWSNQQAPWHRCFETCSES